jgi:hypothetical protein
MRKRIEMSEIDVLVSEYNEIELAQADRLRRLWRLVNDRKGYRRVSFTGGELWSNSWGMEERFAFPRTVDRMTNLVTEVVPGAD